MKPSASARGVEVDREVMEGDVQDLEAVERDLLDTMMSWPSTETLLLPALRRVHGVSWALRNWLESQPKPAAPGQEKTE